MARFHWLGMAAAACAAFFTLAAAPARADVVPLRRCVDFDAAHNRLVPTWEYVNTGEDDVVVFPGASNFFDPPPGNQGQAVIFKSGFHSSVFRTYLDLSSQSLSDTWFVNAFSAEASLDTPLCATPNSAPKQVTAPSVTGTPVVGQTLSADRGVWGYAGQVNVSGGLITSDTFTGGVPGRVDLQWQSEAPGGSWQDIPGATGTTYIPVPDDVGDLLRLQVTALSQAAVAGFSSGQQTVVQTDPTAAVAAAPAAGTPTVSGDPVTGETLTAEPGTWTGVSSFAYDWQRCAATCDSTGQTGTTYVLGAADVGSRLRVVVTPAAAQQPSAASAETDVVRQPSPLSVTPSSVDFGSLSVGRTIVRRLVVKNTGSSSLVFGGVTRTGSAASDFLAPTSCPEFGELPPGHTCSIFVRFRPDTTGTRTAQIQVFAAQGDPPPPVVLTGVGTSPSHCRWWGPRCSRPVR